MVGKQTGCLVLLVMMSLQLSGCASLSGVQAVRALPGMTSAYSKERYYYDPSIGSYRLKAAEGARAPADDAKAARDYAGRKIRTEEGLERFIKAHEPDPIGPGTHAMIIARDCGRSPCTSLVILCWPLGKDV